MKKPAIMGIVNVTPDSFSDGGQFLDPLRAIDHALQLIEEGASIIDIGGESTRPGAAPVSAQEEMDRVLPVIEGLRACDAVVSVDTYRAATMKAALAAGAGMINDVTALRGDPLSLSLLAHTDVPVCLMHMKGEPRTMQDNPVYEDVVREVAEFFAERVRACESMGLKRERLIFDPGIGFGKNLSHNMALLRNLDKFLPLGPVMIGVSRKRFIAQIDQGAAERLPGSLAAGLWAWQKGAAFVRVHDVAATRQALAVWESIAA